MTQYPTGAAGIVNIQQMMLDFLNQTGSPQTGEGGIINMQVLMQQILDGGGLGGAEPPGSTGISTFTTNGTNGPATYNPTTGALNVPNYTTIPTFSGGITNLTTNGASGPSTYSSTTGIMNVPIYARGTVNQNNVRVTAQWTNGSTQLSTGYGFPFTARSNPCVRLSYNIQVSYATASTVPVIGIMRTTSPTIPPQGAALDGSSVTICQTRQLCLINTNNTLVGYFLDTTLTVGVAYNYYIAFSVANAGPATLQWTQDGQGHYINGLWAFEVK